MPHARTLLAATDFSAPAALTPAHVASRSALDAEPIVIEELLPGSVTRHVLAYSSSDVFVAGQSR